MISAPFRRIAGVAATLAGLSVVGMSPAALAMQTKTYVVSLFIQATNSVEGDCPVLNPLPEDAFREEFRGIGMPNDKIEEIIAAMKGGSSDEKTQEAIVNRGRFEGRPVNAFTFPTTVPAEHIYHDLNAKYAFGFNLDGKEAPGSFEDPETHETGVDNGYWRAMGCQNNHRGPAAEGSASWTLRWGINRDKMPAWLITLSTEDFSKDGDVTIKLNKALEHVEADANGYVRADSTFRIDPDPRWKNTLHAKLKDGVVTVTEPGEVHLSGDPYVLTDLDMAQTHMRIRVNDGAKITGLIGGYMPWRRIFLLYGAAGFTEEIMIGTDIPGAFYALRRNADAYPDPKTGENTAISTAWKFEAVPAYAVSLEAQR